MADPMFNGDAGDAGDTRTAKVTRPVTGTGTAARNTQQSAGFENSASTLQSTTSSSPRINHNPSINSLRNPHVGRAGTETGRGIAAAQNAALTGASLAFSNAKEGRAKARAVPPVPNKGNVQLREKGLNGKDGALAAAVKAGAVGHIGGGGGRTRSPSKVSATDEGTGHGQQILGSEKTGESQTTDGGSINGRPEHQIGQTGLQKRKQRSNGHLLPPFSGSGNSTPEHGANMKSSSAAFMAANLAAKRSRESSPSLSQGIGIGIGGGIGKQGSPLMSRRQSYASSIDSLDRRLDVSSIPPTSNLVGMWEQANRGVKKGGVGEAGESGSDRGNEVVSRQESLRRPASSHAAVPVLKPTGLTRPVSSHVPDVELVKSSATKPAVQPRNASSQASISDELQSPANPAVQPQTVSSHTSELKPKKSVAKASVPLRPSSSQDLISEGTKSTSKPVVQARPVSSHTPGSVTLKPSPKPPAEKPVIHNSRPVSSHGPSPNLSAKPSIQKPSRPVSSHGPPPTKPSAKPSLQSIRPTSPRAMESTESLSKSPVQKPSIPAPRRTPGNAPALETHSAGFQVQASLPLSMHLPILKRADRNEPCLKPPAQPPRRSSSTKTPPKSPKLKPPSEPPVSKQSYNNNDDDDDGSSDDSFVSASSQPKPKSPSFRAKIAQQKRSQSTSLSSMNVNSLANAIVAGSLASSRASTPSLSSGTTRPPAPPPTRRHKNLHIFHSDNSRTPTPPQNNGSAAGVPIMKTTMRKPKTGKELKEEEGEGEKRRAKKHLVKKHPNKHNEGNRKRWRDGITERERKRYEAVWASNKGLYPYTVNQDGELVEVDGAVDTVPGVVVRDIWERSRLGEDVLEEVWDLVEGRGYRSRLVANMKAGGRLEKDEFVVGLWLIDQRLKGRKLPGRVGSSVWGSAGAMGGIKIRS
ncbi:42c4dca3-2c85-4c30-bdd5-dee8444e6687 [Sclerotinia trifoliorum]|uniref:42c4dca3-2c85-4c30-bdd5-dee8444e6687 n=1 Tax=Sclerotinia trifoliorum TaxID=28548 RepID=A0A8H2VTT5_9HELO|nr:42c4dca3-2c85-4c30-bdd5-dee8444e6687 [Sclerotinia trifoliorum]